VLRKGHILAILVIGVSFVTVPAFADSNVMFYEVELNPIGEDKGNEWVRLYNPFDYRIDLNGWKIESNLRTYTLTESIEPCEILKITFPSEFLDDRGAYLFLWDNKSVNVASTPTLNDLRISSVYTWKNPNVKLDCNAPIIQEPIIEEPVGMGFYENELYDFSFSVPMDWLYQENYLMPDGSTFQVMTYPERFSPVGSIFDAPIVFVKYESIPEATIPNLNEKSIEKYELEKLRIALPSAKILNYDIKSTPWGWESTLDVVVSLNIPFVVQGEFHEKDTVFYFKDRESYTLGYVSPTAYYDSYLHVYDDVISSTVINGVVVPEFQEIVLMVLGGSIVLVIVIARKFSKFTGSENS